MTGCGTVTALRSSDRDVVPTASRASPANGAAWINVMASSGGTEPYTWTWMALVGSTNSGEVPALPMPSPEDGSGTSRSNGAGRHRDQPPLVRKRARILGGRTPSRHVNPTMVTSAVLRIGVCHNPLPAL